MQHAHRGVQQILRVDDEVQQPAGDALVGRLLDAVRRAARDLDVLLVSDYSKGLIRDDLMRSLLEIAGSEVPVLVDPARLDDYSRYRGAFLICPNRYEAERASGISCREIEGCRRAGTKLLEELDVGVVAMTLDREGILLCERGREPRHIPTRARVVADVTGAGDMVLGVLGLVTAGGGTQEEAAQLANVAAGMEVRHLGVTPIAREELLQELRYEGHPAASKVKSLDELLEAVGEERRDGKSVVFTNGCFDLLHVGHHHLLHEARKEGDLLIVAVNGDGSIRRLKGPTRPSLSQEYRVLMLAGLEVVDYVIVFDEDTPNRLLEAIRPDVLVKGSEYREGIVVGREIVEGYGGRIAFVDQVPGVSTTALLGETPRPPK